MSLICDIHTHRGDIHANAIITTTPQSFNPMECRLYSVGIHPWESNNISDNTINLLKDISTHQQVVAIGECGIDRLRGTCIDIQKDIFEQHILLSEQLHKPLIIHAVKSVDIILSLYNQYKPTQSWIVHGYRGNKTTAKQLLDRGIELSFGEKFNEETVASTPLDRLWIESDESTTDIKEIYSKIALIHGLRGEELLQIITRRAEKLFFSY